MIRAHDIVMKPRTKMIRYVKTQRTDNIKKITLPVDKDNVINLH